MPDLTWLEALMEAYKVQVHHVIGGIGVELCWPRQAEDDPSRPQHVIVDLCDVRAADGIRISYDFGRDGWKIEQAQVFEWDPADEDMDPEWTEVAFVQAWGSRKVG